MSTSSADESALRPSTSFSRGLTAATSRNSSIIAPAVM